MQGSVVGTGMRPYRRTLRPGEKDAHRRKRAFFRIFRRWWFWVLSFAGVFFVALLLLFIFRAPLAAAAARAWIVDEDPKPSDAIVMLSGSVASRPHAVARLWENGYAPTILITRLSGVDGLTISQGDYATNTIRSHGIPVDAMQLLEMEVAGTYDEAISVLTWARANNARRIMVVTDPFHTRRTAWIFRKVMRPWNIEIVVVAAPPVGYEIDRWWDSEFSLVEFPNEIVKYIMYKMKY